MRRILFNEEQKRIIKESLLQQAAMANLPSHLSRDIQSNNTSLSICDTFDGHLGRAVLNKLVAERFDEVKGYFSDDVSNVTPEKVFNKMSKAITLCQKREEAYRDQLEKLCFDILSETFHFPEDAFDLEFHLVNEINPDKSFNIFPEPSNIEQQTSSEDIRTLDEEIQKRRIIDALCVGGAMRITNKAFESLVPELFKIDEELPHLYSMIMKLNEFYLFLSDVKNTEHEHNQAGYTEVVLQTEESPAKITVEGIVFPILLNECVKGILELLASYGLPDNEEAASQIVKVADALSFEPWDMRIGPALFDSIFKNIDDLDTTDIPYILPGIVELNSREFLSLVNECVSGTEKGAEMVQKIAMRGLHDKEYDSFEHDMWSRQNGQEEKPLVTDDEDVIEEMGAYPNSFNMDEFKKITSFNGRVQYCKQRLKYLGKGSSRIVFLVDNNTVLKLAWNQKGVAQNEAEARVKNDYVLSGYDFLPEVYDVDEQYLWIEMAIARKATKKDWLKITGYPWETFYYWVVYCWNQSVAHPGWKQYIPPEYKNLFASDEWRDKTEYSVYNEIEDYIGNYDVEGWGDLCSIRNWGVATDENGNEHVVLIDNGLDNDVLDKYYRK